MHFVLWGLSSAGRASALQAEGHRFEPCRPHGLPILYGGIAQLARAHGSYPWCRWFKSSFRYSLKAAYLRGFFFSEMIGRRWLEHTVHTRGVAGSNPVSAIMGS